MKQLSLLLSILAAGISGVLLFMQLKGNGPAKPNTPATTIAGADNTVSASGAAFRIAYFELDSLQNNYQYFKDALEMLKKKEEEMNNELAFLDKKNKTKIGEWQQKGNNMSQAEAEAANRQYQQMAKDFQDRKQQLEQGINQRMSDTQKKIRERLEMYLKEYNKDKRYSYIFSDFPEAIFYKDTVYNITGDLIKGLNESYKKKN